MTGIQYYNNQNKVHEYFDWCLTETNLPSTLTKMIMKSIVGVPDFFKGGTLIDLMSGPGNSIADMESLGFENYVAVDGSEEMLTFINENKIIHKGTIQTIKADMLHEPLPISDAGAAMVNCFCGMQFVSDISNIFSETARLLRPKGIFGFNLLTHWEKESNLIPFINHNSIECHIHSFNRVSELMNQNNFRFVAPTDLSVKYVNTVDGIPYHSALFVTEKK